MVQRSARICLHGFHIQTFQIFAQHTADRVGTADLTVQLDILRDGKAREQHELLMHHADALGHRVMRRGDGRLLAVEIDFAAEAACFVDDRHAEQHVHQRRFTRTVLSKERMDLTFFHRKGNALKYRVFPVLLTNVFHLKNIVCVHEKPLSLR